MKGVFLFFTVCVFSFACLAQDLKTVEVPRGAQRQSKQVVDGITTHNYTKKSNVPVNGNPYFEQDFLPGILELNDGSKSDEMPIRYNIASDAFEVIQSSDTLSLNQPYKLKQIIYDDRVFIFDPELRAKAERKYNGFFELKVKGELSLYIKRNKDLLLDSFTSNYQGGSGTKEYYYVDKVSYVGKFNDGSGFLIKSKKEFLDRVDGQEKSDIKSFIKKNKIKFKSEEDIVKLVEYVNSI
ncbi:hypothetical protein GM418_16220 [Maribellus comscasis]|uniref:Uncharacterized protein n=1 Tax=Maribellus comscasis TaxID=2681766 RepID=A0A6I6JVK8_9BACT|nr:hypothetical protein [Maribellus comscasis]QGY45160.1 hypothetical protein GM418_16220 [Maribellus comscasis]